MSEFAAEPAVPDAGPVSAPDETGVEWTQAPEPAAGEQWVPPTREEVEAANQALAFYEQMFTQDQQPPDMAAIQDGLVEGDPAALEWLGRDIQARIAEHMAPEREFVGKLQQELAVADAEAEAADMVDAELARLGVNAEGADEDVWQRANEILGEAHKEVLASEMPDDMKARFFSPEGARWAIAQAAEQVAREHAPAPGNVPNAITRRFFGGGLTPQGATQTKGLGNVPNAVTRKFFG